MGLKQIKENMVGPGHYVAVLKIEMKEMIEVIEAAWSYKVHDDEAWKRGGARGEGIRAAYVKLSEAFKKLGMQ